MDLTTKNIKLILASASPRRLELLKKLGLEFDIVPSSINEELTKGETPHQIALDLATQKALWVAKLDKSSAKETYILGADTLVVLDNKIYGKPKDKEEAKSMLKSLSGRTHEVLTGYILVKKPSQIIVSDVESSRVTFKKITSDEIDNYVETKEPMDKAGAYAAQGKGKQLIERIEGLETNVIGLPVEKLIPWFQKLGFLNHS